MYGCGFWSTNMSGCALKFPPSQKIVYLKTYVRVATGVRQGDAIVYFEHWEVILHSFDFTLSNINFNYVYSF